MHPQPRCGYAACPAALRAYTDTGLFIPRDLSKIITFHLCRAIIKAFSNFMLLSVSV